MTLRSKARSIFAAGLLLGSVVAAPAHAASPTPDELVAQLTDPDPAKQADARQKLLALGDAAKPALERLAKSRGATEALLSAIETNKVAAPTYVTLKMDNTSVEAVLKAISKQTGYSLKPYNQGMWAGRGNQAKISIDYNKTPFWDAVVDLCRKGQISPYFNGGTGKQMLFLPSAQMGMSFIDCPLSTSGGAMTLFTNLSRYNTVTFNGNNASTSHDFSGQLMVLVEPKMRVTRYTYQPTIEEAVDDKGNSLVPAGGSDNSGWNSTNQQTQINLGMNLIYPKKNPGTKIAKLRGKLKLTVAVRSEPIEFTDLTGEKERTLTTPSGRRLTLTSVKPMTDNNNPGADNRQYVAQVTIYRDKMEQNKFNELSSNPGITLLDAQGRDLQFQNVRDTRQNGTDATLSIVYYRRSADEGGDDVGVPSKLVWDVTTETRDIDLPFEFKDLPMP